MMRSKAVMKPILPLLALCGVVFGAAAARAESVDGIVATVDTEVILHSDLMFEVGGYLNELRATLGPEEFQGRAEQVLADALEQAIQNRILVREARLQGLEVDDAIVEKRLSEYRSDANTAQFIDSSGYTMPELRDMIRKNFLARAMDTRKRQELARNVVVSESDVAQYYEDNIGQFSHPERVYVRQIFLPASADASERTVIRARLAELKDQIAAGADFVDLAKAYSKGPGAEDGGTIGWVARGDLQPELEEAAFATEVGGVSDIVERDQGFHLLRVDRREGAGSRTLDEVRSEIEPMLRRRAADARFQDWMAELRKRSRVQVFL